MATKKVLFTILLSAVVLVLFAGMDGVRGRLTTAQSNVASAQSNTADDFIAVRDALRRGGLREAAKLKGHYVEEYDPHWDFGQYDLEGLSKNSAAVIVGVATKKLASRLEPNGEMIVTDYEVAVREVIKGDLKPGATVTVSLTGGRVEFEDGTSAEVVPTDFEHMKPGGTYAILLSESESAPGTYTPTGGPQGLVELAAEGKVKSHGRATDLSAQESKDKSKEDFLKELRHHAKYWPHPGKCCN